MKGVKAVPARPKGSTISRFPLLRLMLPCGLVVGWAPADLEWVAPVWAAPVWAPADLEWVDSVPVLRMTMPNSIMGIGLL